jgi:transposase-like protein
MKKQYTPSQKAAIALAALKEEKTINQIASENELHPTQVRRWRDALKANAQDIFLQSNIKTKSGSISQSEIDELHRVIGIRDAELEWLKKKIHGLGL